MEEKQNRLQEIPDAIQGQLEELSGDEKETISPALNDANDAFVPKAIPALVKELKVDQAENAHVLDVLQQVEKLNKEEKQLKSQVKNGQAQLVEDTRKKIEALTPEEVRQLLVAKWINPLTEEMQKLPETLLDGLIKKLEALDKKYETTLEDVESQIQDTEKSLCQMLGDLTGSDTDMAGVRELQKLLGGK